VTTVLAIIGGWFVASIPLGLLVGKFLRRGSQ
jgi:hypothetical protein